MLESNSIRQSWEHFNFHVPHPIGEIMKRGVEELFFLFLVEETTEKGDIGHSDYVNTEISKTRGTIKGVFWVVVSIVVALTIGQL